jgi:hypothetical protein
LEERQFTRAELATIFVCAFVLPSAYLGGVFIFGCRRFQRLEDANTLPAEFEVSRRFGDAFGRLANMLTLGHSGALGHLVRKELRLQLPTFTIAVWLVGFWGLIVVVALTRQGSWQEGLIGPPILLCFAVPIVAGVISTAEERSLGGMNGT